MSIKICSGLKPYRPQPPQHGELSHEIDTNKIYYYNKYKEKYILLASVSKEEEKKEKRRNCTNCGAPLTHGEVCEYCGTIH